MTPEQIQTASEMWHSGAVARDIAAVLGMRHHSLAGLCRRYRHLFPVRAVHRFKQNGRRHRRPLPVGCFLEDKTEIEVRAVKPKPGTMRWVTNEGAIVTLVRISFIDCPRDQGRAML